MHRSLPTFQSWRATHLKASVTPPLNNKKRSPTRKEIPPGRAFMSGGKDGIYNGDGPGLLRGRLKGPHEIENNINLLFAVPAGLVGGVYLNALDKLVHDLRGQFLHLRVLPGKAQEPFRSIGLFFGPFQCSGQFRLPDSEGGLLGFVTSGKFVEAFFGQLAADAILRELLSRVNFTLMKVSTCPSI